MTSGLIAISKKLHSPDLKEKYKTELCRNWANGFCPFDDKCAFAHGRQELREKVYSKADEIDDIEIIPIPIEYNKKRLPVFVELSKRFSKEND